MTSNVIIKADSLSRRYRKADAPALDGVSFEMARGASLLLSGPSGSGKSTLLNLIAGLDRADAGKLWVMGEELSRLGEGDLAKRRSRSVGVVFQHHLLPPGLTAEEVVAAPLLWSRDLPLAEAIAKARRALGIVELGSDLAGRLVQQLSGGQRQRVAFARAIAPDPELLLADEPTAQLDEHSANVLLDALMSWKEGDAAGRSLVVVSHERLPSRHLDRFQVLRLSEGRIQA